MTVRSFLIINRVKVRPETYPPTNAPSVLDILHHPTDLWIRISPNILILRFQVGFGPRLMPDPSENKGEKRDGRLSISDRTSGFSTVTKNHRNDLPISPLVP